MAASSSNVRPIHDGGQLLERATDLGALAGHGLKQHGGGLLRLQHPVQHGGYFVDAHLDTLLHMGAGMHVVQLARGVLHALQVVGQHLLGKLDGALRGGGGVQRVGRVCDECAQAVFLGVGMEGRNVGGIDVLGTSPSWIACEELEGVRPDGHGIPCHVLIPL